MHMPHQGDAVSHTIGSHIDNLGITVEIKDGELITGAVLLTAIVDTDGDERLSVACSDGLSWMKRTGMLTQAQHDDVCACE